VSAAIPAPDWIARPARSGRRRQPEAAPAVAMEHSGPRRAQRPPAAESRRCRHSTAPTPTPTPGGGRSRRAGARIPRVTPTVRRRVAPVQIQRTPPAPIRRAAPAGRAAVASAGPPARELRVRAEHPTR
jgi:hypothetical protein